MTCKAAATAPPMRCRHTTTAVAPTTTRKYCTSKARQTGTSASAQQRETLTCRICLAPLVEPVKIPSCGHRFCRVCIARVAWHAATNAAREAARAAHHRHRRDERSAAQCSSSCNIPPRSHSTATLNCPLCRCEVQPSLWSQTPLGHHHPDPTLTLAILTEWPTDDTDAFRMPIYFSPHRLSEAIALQAHFGAALGEAVALRRPLGEETRPEHAMFAAGGYMHRVEPSLRLPSVRPRQGVGCSKEAQQLSTDSDCDSDDDAARRIRSYVGHRGIAPLPPLP